MINNRKELDDIIPIILIINIVAMFMSTSQTRYKVYECYLEKDEIFLLNINSTITFASQVANKVKN